MSGVFLCLKTGRNRRCPIEKAKTAPVEERKIISNAANIHLTLNRGMPHKA